MQQTFNGQLGKQSTSLIARMVSSKMPGGFNITAVRKHLETVPCVRRGRLKLYSVTALQRWLDENAERLLDDRRAA